MKIRTRAARVVTVVVLLAGMTYSVLALTLATKTAYASSCDCGEAAQDARELCTAFQAGAATTFQCPVGSSQDEFSFTCEYTGSHLYTFSCTY